MVDLVPGRLHPVLRDTCLSSIKRCVSIEWRSSARLLAPHPLPERQLTSSSSSGVATIGGRRSRRETSAIAYPDLDTTGGCASAFTVVTVGLSRDGGGTGRSVAVRTACFSPRRCSCTCSAPDKSTLAA